MVHWELEAEESSVGVDIEQLAVLCVGGKVDIVVAVVVELDETPAGDVGHRVDRELLGDLVAKKIGKGLLVGDVTNLDDLGGMISTHLHSTHTFPRLIEDDAVIRGRVEPSLLAKTMRIPLESAWPLAKS